MSKYNEPERLFYLCDLTSGDDYSGNAEARYVQVLEPEANLISSRIVTAPDEPDLHAPVIDIDVPCRLVESSTRGHHHLYIDKMMTWDQYRYMLRSMASAGVVEWGFYNAAVLKKHTLVRKPGVIKANENQLSLF